MAKSKEISKTDDSYKNLVSGVVELLENARMTAGRSVNAIMTATYWEVGRRIVEHEQEGAARAEYGKALLKLLSSDLTETYGRGFGKRNLEQMRRFYLTYQITQKPYAQSELSPIAQKSSAQFTSNLSKFPLSWSHYVCLMSEKRSPQENSMKQKHCVEAGL